MPSGVARVGLRDALCGLRLGALELALDAFLLAASTGVTLCALRSASSEMGGGTGRAVPPCILAGTALKSLPTQERAPRRAPPRAAGH